MTTSKPSIHWTAKQRAAKAMLASDARYVLLYGGSRSGKTFLLVWAVVYRALKAPASRHLILRRHFNACKRSIVYDTFPKVMQLCFPGVAYDMNKTDWFVRLPNDSEVWFGGLDDKERTEKILGNEYSSIYFNECSELSYVAVTTALTRLAQRSSLTNRTYFDCNPPTKRHWVYPLFMRHENPITKEPINVAQYVCMKLNPEDNKEHLADGYIENILASLPRAQRRRFLEGEFADDSDGALWRRSWIDNNRVQKVPATLDRVVIGVDPAVSANPDSDDTGIVCGARVGDEYYVLDDETRKASPAEWARVVIALYHRREADKIIGEGNNGGDLVKRNIEVEDSSVPVRIVHATRGKAIRAEPISAMYEQGRVHHVGTHDLLEDELCTWNPADSTAGSPNRLDALVWAMTELSGKRGSTRPMARSY